MEKHFETYDGEDKMDLISPHVQNINLSCSADQSTKVHLDLCLPPLRQIDDIKVISELLKQIENIEIERPE